MNYPVKWFSSEMPGAPILNGHPGALISVLDACLLNGWGLVSVDTLTFDSNTGEATLTITGGHGFIVDQVILTSGANEAEFNGEQRVTWIDSTTVKFKPVHIPQVATASGSITAKVAPHGSWAKPHSSGDNLKAIYQSSSPNRLSSAGLYIDDSNTHTTPTEWSYNGANTQAQAYGSFTDLDTRTELINTDDNYQCIRKSYTTNSTYLDHARSWKLFADEQFVYFFADHTAQGVPVNPWYNGYLFGEIISYKPSDEFAYLVQMGQQSASTSKSTSNLVFLTHSLSRYLHRDISGLTPPADVGYKGMVLRGDYMGYQQMSDFPSPTDNGLYIADRVFVYEGKDAGIKVRGELPGIGYPLHDAPLSDGFIVNVPWKGGTKKVMAVTIPYSTNQSASSISKGQCLVDIEGPWRS